MLLENQKNKIIEIGKRIHAEKLVPLTFGNFSVRDFDTGYICITPSGMPYEALTPEDIVVVDIDGNIVDGKRRPSIETGLHCAVYKKRPEVGSVVHTHSTFVTAWASCNKEIPSIVAEVAALVSGKIKCAPYRPCGSKELAEVTSDCLGEDDAVLLGNHGVLVVGKDIDTAYINAVIVEEGAKVAYYAQNIGGMRILDEKECAYERESAKKGYGQI
ncbi:class II aldolase/adducin family protein [Wukongibacter sp. M2B1]|uniref:class II aldolase/adducin family protein n=1 Tax=Wukongibacter sp. M2B1 TaxID=3088895 RepID=UPI003D7AB3E3